MWWMRIATYVLLWQMLGSSCRAAMHRAIARPAFVREHVNVERMAAFDNFDFLPE